MLNKELLMCNTEGQQPVALTVSMQRQEGTSLHEYGYDRVSYGKLAPQPFWGNSITLQGLTYYESAYTTCRMTDRSITVTIYVSGYHDSPIRSGETIYNDIFELRQKIGQTVYLTFDPPPMVTWTQRLSNRSRNRVLCRRRSLGGSRCLITNFCYQVQVVL